MGAEVAAAVGAAVLVLVGLFVLASGAAAEGAVEGVRLGALVAP